MGNVTHQSVLEKVHAGQLNRKEGFYEIPTVLFLPRIDVNMPTLPALSLYDFSGQKPELIRKPDQPFSTLVLSQHEFVWVKEDEFAAIQSYAEAQLIKPTPGEGIPAEQRMEALRKSAIIATNALFEHPTPENIAKSTRVVGSFVYVLMRDPKAYMLLTKLSSHDHYTLQHSVGASVNCIILARKIGINDEKELLEVGMAGLLHDVGKVHVNKEIINKQGPLNELEWEEMRQHSGAGFAIIKDNPTLSDRTKRAVLEHHEDKTGNGYPHGMKYTDVHIFSKIVAISDIFNALTTDRSYSKARSPFDAFQLMREKIMHKMDDNLFKELVKIYGGEFDAAKKAA